LSATLMLRRASSRIEVVAARDDSPFRPQLERFGSQPARRAAQAAHCCRRQR
jgi:hypothetical protein